MSRLRPADYEQAAQLVLNNLAQGLRSGIAQPGKSYHEIESVEDAQRCGCRMCRTVVQLSVMKELR